MLMWVAFVGICSGEADPPSAPEKGQLHEAVGSKFGHEFAALNFGLVIHNANIVGI